MRIGFDLDGVILNNTLFKSQKLKEIYNLNLEEWKLSSNLIDIYVPDKKIRHHLGRLAGTSSNDYLVDGKCPKVLKALHTTGFEIYLVSRRGKSNMGVENAYKSILKLDVKKYFAECHFCETEQEKADKIAELELTYFFDDRSEMIDSLTGRIEHPVLFDPFKTVERGLVGAGKEYCNVKDFTQIESLLT